MSLIESSRENNFVGYAGLYSLGQVWPDVGKILTEFVCNSNWISYFQFILTLNDWFDFSFGFLLSMRSLSNLHAALMLLLDSFSLVCHAKCSHSATN